jgi:hypothetical protein
MSRSSPLSTTIVLIEPRPEEKKLSPTLYLQEISSPAVLLTAYLSARFISSGPTLKKKKKGQGLWCMPRISALQRLRQKDLH